MHEKHMDQPSLPKLDDHNAKQDQKHKNKE